MWGCKQGCYITLSTNVKSAVQHASCATHRVHPCQPLPLWVCSPAGEVPSRDNNHFLRTQSAFLRRRPIPVNNIPALGNKNHEKTIISLSDPKASPLPRLSPHSPPFPSCATCFWCFHSEFHDNDWAWLKMTLHIFTSSLIWNSKTVEAPPFSAPAERSGPKGKT